MRAIQTSAITATVGDIAMQDAERRALIDDEILMIRHSGEIPEIALHNDRTGLPSHLTTDLPTALSISPEPNQPPQKGANICQTDIIVFIANKLIKRAPPPFNGAKSA